MQRIVILGKPNVGKSTLFNCLIKERKAITSQIEGTTRDINIKQTAIDDLKCVVCDTAGITDDGVGIFKDIKQKILSFIKNDDILLYVIDGSEGIDDYDIKMYRTLKNATLIVNKIDSPKHITQKWEYNIFDSKNILYVSAANNRGLGKLKEYIKLNINNKHLESINTTNNSYIDNLINVGIIGRVNVGKSSILNALVGTNRSVVSEIEGTTIDPVDEQIIHKDFKLNFIDTAGIRRRSKINGIEKYALDRTKKILESSDIALLILDSSKDFVELDEKISGLSDRYNLGIIIILNKWDIKYKDFKNIEKTIRRKFAYLNYAPIITASTLSKKHITNIKDKIIEIYSNFNKRISTSKLNECIENAIKRHPLPSDNGKIIKIYYATQIATKPPTIILMMNKPNALHFSYKRYLINSLRREFDFTGTPIIILPRDKNKQQENKD